MADTYEVLVPELTVLKTIGVLRDPISGQEIGVQQGAGRIALAGEVLDASEISSLWVEALDDEDNPLHESISKKLRKSGDSARDDVMARTGLPFTDYDGMDEDDILAVLRHMPSSVVQAVKKYEAVQANPRERIVDYNIGFGESPTDRIEGRVSSDLDEENAGDASKPTAILTTREVGEDTVQLGEGMIGDGQPQRPYGSTAEKENGEDDDESAPDPETEKKQPTRRSRRRRNAPKKDGDAESEATEDPTDENAGEQQ